MKKIYLFCLCALCAFTALAQSDTDYYIDIQGDNVDYYFTWDASLKCYTLKMDKIDKNFKIYSQEYKTTQNDEYIFGATQAGSAGIIPDIALDLSHPGQDISVEGGKVLYNATFYFVPAQMKLYVADGSFTPVETAKIDVDVYSVRELSGTSAEVVYTIIPTLIDNADTQSYDVTLTYTDAAGDAQTLTATLTGSTQGSFTLTGLDTGSYPFTITAKTTYNDTELSDTASGIAVITGAPILIGQIQDHSWEANYGITGVESTTVEGAYQFIVKLADSGEFSFVSKLGTTATDWDTVNAYPRFAPASNRVTAPTGEWIPYTTFNGSTTNAWVPENFSTELPDYRILFRPSTQEIILYNYDIETGVDVLTEQAAPVDVYSVDGMLVRRGADASHPGVGLPAGLYIAAGKKILVK